MSANNLPNQYTKDSCSISETSPERTAAYRSMMAGRAEVLRRELRQIFPRPSAFVWELGCGHGHFLAAYAAAHPEQICIGIDIAGDRIARGLRKRDRARLANLHFLHAEARLFLEVLTPDTPIARTFILFPDPWPKSRHHKHRILQPDFLSQLASRSTPAARLHFRTDFAPYFESAAATLAADARWEPRAEPWPFEQETVFQQRAPTYQSVTAVLRRQALAGV